jgi:hypothetical protein
VFSRTDTVTDSERFYSSVLDYFEDVDEQDEVRELLIWWNRSVRIMTFSVYPNNIPYAGKLMAIFALLFIASITVSFLSVILG